MDFFYRKNNSTFANYELLNIESIQNYIPIYEKFFDLNNKNYNSINLNNSYTISNVIEKKSDNTYVAEILDPSNVVYKRDIFVKFSPLLDPVKYLCDKYRENRDGLFNLPRHCSYVDDESNKYYCHSKIIDTNNAAFVDGFFSFLISVLLHRYNFVNAGDFYGSFLGIKRDFIYNIEDDIELLNDYEEFHANKDKIYTMNNSEYQKLFNHSTKKRKNKLNFVEEDGEGDVLDIDLNDINDLSCLDQIFSIGENIMNDDKDANPELEEEEPVFDISESISGIAKKGSRHTNSNGSSSTSSCSSRTSNTEDEDGDEGSRDEDSRDEDSRDEHDDESSSEDIENIFVNINRFPVELIVLEKCDNTLDDYMVNNKIRDPELESIILQILFTLITYQKAFNFTHNDLHTNNIMYKKTDKKFLIYRWNDRHYKVPTFGKIYKIIDFGRAIYKFKGHTICSDSYSREGDAHTQYNCEPYLNPDKPCIEPNNSFDLCRLGCSMFDFFVEDLDDIKKIKSPIKRIILNWVLDDKGRNILYKNDGDERYPDFKLYKMIARTVHRHLPEQVLENTVFDKYLTAKKKINNPGQIMNIDAIPVMI